VRGRGLGIGPDDQGATVPHMSFTPDTRTKSHWHLRCWLTNLGLPSLTPEEQAERDSAERFHQAWEAQDPSFLQTDEEREMYHLAQTLGRRRLS
jgi:hypothetical protein